MRSVRQAARIHLDEARWCARVSGGLAAVGFLLLTGLVDRHHTQRIDHAVLHLMRLLRGTPYSRIEVYGGRVVQIHPAPLLEGVARVLGAVGTPSGAGVGLCALTICCWRRSPPRAVALPCVFALVILVEHLCKAKIPQIEPGAYTSVYPYPFHFSYPSGHALAAFFFAAGAGFLFRQPWIWWIGVGLATTVAVGRLYTGDHWLSDVIGGGLVGWCAAATVFSI